MTEQDYFEKVGLFVGGRIEMLISKGLMTGPAPLTPKGIACYDQLCASGFKPTSQEHVEELLGESALFKIPPNHVKGVAKLVMEYNDREDRVK